MTIFWGKKAAYEYGGICPHGEWGEGLFYKSNRNSQNADPVDCAKLGARYAKGAVRNKVPRSPRTRDRATRPARRGPRTRAGLRAADR